MTASRSRRPAALVAATLLIGAVATSSACSAGQLAHTSDQVPAVPGVHGSAGPRGEIALRNVVISYTGPGGYPRGGSAPLELRIINTGRRPVRLVQVTTEGAARVELVAGPVPPQPATPTSTVAPAPSPTASPAASPTPGATKTGQAGVGVEIPAGSYLSLVPGQGPYLRLVGLTETLVPGMTVELTFVFDGDQTTTVRLKVPVGPPSAAVSRAAPEVPGEESE